VVDQLIQSDSDDTERKSIFNLNMEQIKNHNEKQSLTRIVRARFKMGPNHFAHLSIKEIEQKYLSTINLSEVKHSANFLNQRAQGNGPAEEEQVTNCTDQKPKIQSSKKMLDVDSVNWLAEGVLSPVVDQGYYFD